MIIVCSSKEFDSLYQEIKEKTERLRLQVKGGSMYPFIKSGDWVELEPLQDYNTDIRMGDIILFKQEDNLYLHRVIRKTVKGILTRGDTSTGPDGIIPPENVLAKMVSIQRNGKNINLSTIGRRLYSRFLVRFWLVWRYVVFLIRLGARVVHKILALVQSISLYREALKKIITKPVAIRIAEPKDQEQLRDLYLMHLSDIAVSLAETQEKGFWLVALVGNKVAGANTIMPDEKQRWRWYISGLVVKPLWRGLGIGEKLVQGALDKARGAGAIEVGLFVNKESQPAVNLYKKLGFEECSEIPDDFQKAENEIYMRRSL